MKPAATVCERVKQQHSPFGPIAIVGPGAIGCLFAAFLARADHEVWLLDHRADRAKQLARLGITLETGDGQFVVSVRASARPEELPAARLAIILVKAHDTEAAARATSKFLAPDGCALSLQNGLGNLEALSRALGEERVLGGTTAHGAYLLGVGHVRHAGSGPTIIGEQKPRGATPEPPPNPPPRVGRAREGASPGPSRELAKPIGRPRRVREIVRLFRASGIEAEATDNLPQAIWNKLVMNCAVNPVAAICRLRNGQLAQNPWSLKLMQSAALEAAKVAAAQGILLSYPDPAERVKQVCEATAPNINSMLQDMLFGRRTEIEAINGAVAELARRLGVETPVNEALAAAVRAIEQEMDRQVSPAGMAASEGDSARGRQVGPQDIA